MIKLQHSLSPLPNDAVGDPGRGKTSSVGLISDIPPSTLRGLIHDFTVALCQQMFFWGRDVKHPQGNLLQAHGFDRQPSKGLDGTSCYRLALSGGTLELHGACAGLFSRSIDGFLFIRNRNRCYLYSEATPPVPGVYALKSLRSGPATDLYAVSRHFLNWWLDYEAWISEITDSSYRAACYRAFRKLPQSRPWLPPAQALQWLGEYAHNPATLSRAREWKNKSTCRS